MMKYLISAASAAFALSFLVQPALAKGFDVQLDGQMPIYPRGHLVEDIPANALRAGVPLNETTSDSIHLVDLWFKSNLPKDCRRLAASGGVRWTCPAGTIVIQNHNGTFISYIPSAVQF
jgi:hypothetical protein